MNRLTLPGGSRRTPIRRIYYKNPFLFDSEVDEETTEKKYNEKKLECDQYNKLADLEDIEEKRGISLSVLDRLLDYFDEVCIDNSDKPFYVKFLDGIYPVNPVHLQFDFRNKRLVEEYNLDSPDDKTYPFSEYGRTWALTEAELETKKDAE